MIFYIYLTAGAVPIEKKFQIVKPWSQCLAENKRIWKEQAEKGYY